MKSGNGEFRITFSDRTKESIAKLGIPPEKFGIVADVAEVAKNPEEVAKKVAKNLEEVAKRLLKESVRLNCALLNASLKRHRFRRRP